MTYRELDYKATRLLDNAEITLGEYEKMTKPLDREIEQEPRWIPCSEKLPEKSIKCLVAVGRLNFTEIAIYSDLMGMIDHKIFYQGDVGHDSFKNITKYVKAWMPLPKPYEPQESEGNE